MSVIITSLDRFLTQIYDVVTGKINPPKTKRLPTLVTGIQTLFDWLTDSFCESQDWFLYIEATGLDDILLDHCQPISCKCLFQLDTTHVPGIGKCCDKHDICYDTCNHQKEDCDKEFQACLMKICNAMKTHVSKDVYNGESLLWVLPPWVIWVGRVSVRLSVCLSVRLPSK